MISKEFGVGPSIHLWCTPFSPSGAVPEDKNIWLVQRAGKTFPAFGNYVGTTGDKKDTSAISIGAPIAKLTQDGELTSEGHQYCVDYGVQKDTESLTKWTKSQTPEEIKYQGHEPSRAPV